MSRRALDITHLDKLLLTATHKRDVICNGGAGTLNATELHIHPKASVEGSHTFDLLYATTTYNYRYL